MAQIARTRRALVSAAFVYAQYFVALFAAFFVTPVILGTIGARNYGIWLSTGEIVGYLVLMDLGVTAVLPWLIARADGEQRPDEIKMHLVHALLIAGGVTLVIVVLLSTSAQHIPALLRMQPSEWSALRGPLIALGCLAAVNLPMTVFGALLTGLQDVHFSGPLNLVRGIVAPAVTIALLVSGYGLYALAIGTAALPPIFGLVALARGYAIAPHVFQAWPRPSLRAAARLFREGVGGWLGSAGVQMIERSSALILVLLASPTIVPTLVCTSKLSQVLTQMAWVLPDSALIGFAQLAGEKNATRVSEVGLSIFRLNTVIAGYAATLVLAINPAFVRMWVGEQFFGGLLLNGLLAAGVLAGSFAHACATVVSAHGQRFSVGVVTIVQGALFVGLALTLGRHSPLHGVVWAAVLAPFFSTIPICLRLLHTGIGLDLRRLGREVGSILLLRAAPAVALALVYGVARAQHASFAELAAVGLVLSLIYLRLVRAVISTFPIPGAAGVLLRKIRIIK